MLNKKQVELYIISEDTSYDEQVLNSANDMLNENIGWELLNSFYTTSRIVFILARYEYYDDAGNKIELIEKKEKKLRDFSG